VWSVIGDDLSYAHDRGVLYAGGLYDFGNMFSDAWENLKLGWAEGQSFYPGTPGERDSGSVEVAAGLHSGFQALFRALIVNHPDQVEAERQNADRSAAEAAERAQRFWRQVLEGTPGPSRYDHVDRAIANLVDLAPASLDNVWDGLEWLALWRGARHGLGGDDWLAKSEREPYHAAVEDAAMNQARWSGDWNRIMADLSYIFGGQPAQPAAPAPVATPTPATATPGPATATPGPATATPTPATATPTATPAVPPTPVVPPVPAVPRNPVLPPPPPPAPILARQQSPRLAPPSLSPAGQRQAPAGPVLTLRPGESVNAVAHQWLLDNAPDVRDYVVDAGPLSIEWLSDFHRRIAAANGVPVEALDTYQAGPLRMPAELPPLPVLSPNQVVVEPGNTLWYLAERQAKLELPGRSGELLIARTKQLVREIKRLNPGVDPDSLRIGQIITLPAGR
jgi:LysM domain